MKEALKTGLLISFCPRLRNRKTRSPLKTAENILGRLGISWEAGRSSSCRTPAREPGNWKWAVRAAGFDLPGGPICLLPQE
jgi:hypothetical protein